MHDTENKSWWVKEWRSAEEEFVGLAQKSNLNIQINPAKEIDVYAPDLLIDNKLLGDLKCQRAPFFSSGRYGMNPQTCVTFNRKDYERYSRLYRDIIIIFWVKWETLSYKLGGRIIEVNPLEGFWWARFEKLSKLIEDAPLHAYKRRINDKSGNAKDSFLIDLNDLKSLPLDISSLL